MYCWTNLHSILVKVYIDQRQVVACLALQLENEVKSFVVAKPKD